MKPQNLQEKLQSFIDCKTDFAEKSGKVTFSTCGPGSNFDQDIWSHRNEIFQAIKERGFNVETSVNWGVTDVIITKKMNLV